MLGPVDRRARPVGGIIQRADPVEDAQQVADVLVELGLGHLTGAHGLAQGLAVELPRAGHLEVEPGGRRPGSRARAQPVGEHEAFEPPLVAQDRGDQRGVLRAVRAVEPVVRGHDAQRAALAHRELEGHEVELAQRAGVDHRVDAVALELGVVTGEVLHRGDHPLRLHTAHEGGRGLPREQRILRVALEVPARER